MIFNRERHKFEVDDGRGGKRSSTKLRLMLGSINFHAQRQEGEHHPKKDTQLLLEKFLNNCQDWVSVFTPLEEYQVIKLKRSL